MPGLREATTRFPSLPWTASARDARRVLETHAAAPAVALIVGDTPRALFSRTLLNGHPAARLARGPLASLPARWLAHRDPVVVDADMEIEALARMLLTERPDALRDGFAITENGRYAGVGSGHELFEVVGRSMKRRANELERLYNDALSASRAKSAFLANMSHELRTPLNAIIGFTDIIRSETFGKIQPGQNAEYVEVVNVSGKHLLGVINAVLDMSKIEAGELVLDEKWIDVVEMVEDCFRMLRVKAERVGVTLKLSVPKPVRLVRGDRQRSSQVMLNLLTNAIKFSHSGCLIEVRIAVDGSGDLWIAVTDDGIGIPADRLDDVLLPFHQIESAHSRRNHGSGLGLPLAKALIEAHGGVFAIDSKLGEGSTVSFTYPMHRLGEPLPAKPDEGRPTLIEATPLSA